MTVPQVFGTPDPPTQFMLDDLAKSCLTPEMIGAVVVDDSSKFMGRIGYRIPYPNKPTWTIRWATGDRYARPSKVQLIAAFGEEEGLLLATAPYLLDPVKPSTGIVDIFEGEKRAACATYVDGRTAGAYGGKDNWKDPRSKKRRAIHPHTLTWLVKHKGKQVRLWSDGDLAKYGVRSSYGDHAATLERAGYEVIVVDTSPWGFEVKYDDLRAKGYTYDQIFDKCKQLKVGELAETHKGLIERSPHLIWFARGDSDSPKIFVDNNETNLHTILTEHEAFAGKIRWNLDRGKTFYGDKVLGPEQEQEILGIIQRDLHFVKPVPIGMSMLKSVLDATSLHNQFSPWSDYLRARRGTWDGKPRIDTYLIDYCGAPDTPFNRQVCRRFLLSIAARTFTPGCFLRWMFIHIGEQGIGKSGLVKLLVGEENVVEVKPDTSQGKDELMIFQNGVVILYDELGSLFASTRTAESTKNIVSSTKDTFRMPYGKQMLDFPRRCVLYATGNDMNFISYDPSGLTRYAVVQSLNARNQHFNFSALLAARDQLWAEVMDYIESRGGLPLADAEYASVEGAHEVAEQYIEAPMYLDEVQRAVNNLLKVKITEKENHRWCTFKARTGDWIQSSALKAQVHGLHDRGLGLAMRRLGWEPCNRFDDARGWFKAASV